MRAVLILYPLTRPRGDRSQSHWRQKSFAGLVAGSFELGQSHIHTKLFYQHGGWVLPAESHFRTWNCNSVVATSYWTDYAITSDVMAILRET